jgi:hypothetical protein
MQSIIANTFSVLICFCGGFILLPLQFYAIPHHKWQQYKKRGAVYHFFY